MKSAVVDESLSSAKPMYCSREYFKTSRLIQQYEKSTLNKDYDLLLTCLYLYYDMELVTFGIDEERNLII